MLDETTVMRQAGMTAHDWMLEAAEFVEQRFADYPPQARAALIAAYTTAAASDEVAMYVRALAEANETAGDALADCLRALADAVSEKG